MLSERIISIISNIIDKISLATSKMELMVTSLRILSSWLVVMRGMFGFLFL